MIANAEALLKPLTLKGVTIRNRVMSTSHAPGYGKDGKPQERRQLYHEKKAEGGIGLTIVAVHADAPTAPSPREFETRPYRMRPKVMAAGPVARGDAAGRILVDPEPREAAGEILAFLRSVGVLKPPA